MAPPSATPAGANAVPAHPRFGSDVPYAEPPWYRGAPTPYYDATHVALRARVRAFVEEHLAPHVDEWEERCARYGEEVDFRTIAKKARAAGVFAPMYPAELGGTPLPEGVPFDAFHDLVWIDELSRIGATGVIASLTIYTMALPPILRYGSPELQRKIVQPVLNGDKVVALCITEPGAGSDMAALAATAEKTPDGKFYKVNGQKKWSTASFFADYLTVAVRTGGKGHGGISVLVVDRNTPGIEVKRMKLQGQWTAGTGYVTFDDVLVPVDNLLGKEGEGFKILARNLQHERLVIAVQAIRFCRLCIEDSVAFARLRKTFGKRLVDHQVIQHKIVEMARLTEAAWAMAESLAYQLKCGASDQVVAGPMAMLKIMAGRALETCCRESSQILGGASYTREGKGQRVERLAREVRSFTVAGGSEEILANYVASQAKL